MQSEWVTTTRECTALRVPDGNPITVPEGTLVFLTQALGDSYTVNLDGNLYRIEAQDADALGKSPDQFEFENIDPNGNINEAHIWQVLKTCYDPEIPVNIVDLGLVYEYRITDNTVFIKMTLTAPGCGMGGVIVEEAKTKLRQVPNVTSAEVELTFDPPWSREMLSEVAKVELGLF